MAPLHRALQRSTGFLGLSKFIAFTIGGSFNRVVFGSVRMIPSTTLPNPSSSKMGGSVRR